MGKSLCRCHWEIPSSLINQAQPLILDLLFIYLYNEAKLWYPNQITENKPWNVLWSPATPRSTPMGCFNYLHSTVLLWKKMCWFNQDITAVYNRDQKGMLNGSVHISSLGVLEDADIMTGFFPPPLHEKLRQIIMSDFPNMSCAFTFYSTEDATPIRQSL